MKMNYTPGPWFAVDYAGFWAIQAKPEYGAPDLLAEKFTEGSGTGPTAEQARANAVLAAAAPEMAAAIITFLDWAKKQEHHLVVSLIATLEAAGTKAGVV